MGKTEIARSAFWRMALCMILLIALTRGITLDHHLLSHPDEHVFYGSTELLMESVLYGHPYEPLKPYPEGTYVFRLPFHLLAQVLPLDTNYEVSVSLWGRVSSVFYYTAGALLGLWLVTGPLRGGRSGAWIYIFAVCFGLFQIEQSRYGTFDPISFLMLMLVIVLCVKALNREKPWHLPAAAFVVGIAAAGKYPLAYFSLLPLSVLFLKKTRGWPLWRNLVLMLLGGGLGFLLFSPSVLRSPFFFLQTIWGGAQGYLVGGNPEGYSTVAESAFSVLAYHNLYSDLPLAGLFALQCVLGLNREGEHAPEQLFVARVLPAITLVFLGYNLLLTTFFLRTLFPFFFLSLPYAAVGLGRLSKRKHWGALAAVLCVVMTARGCVLVALMRDREDSWASETVIEEIERLGGSYTSMGSYFFTPEINARIAPSEIVTNQQLYEGDFPELTPGIPILTASLQHGMAKTCIFPPDKEMAANISGGWAAFREENAPWLVARSYPEWMYQLFGFWVHGSTATNYEFQSDWLYYKPADA